MANQDKLAARRAQLAQEIEMSEMAPQPATNGHAAAQGNSFLSEAGSIQESIDQFNSNVRLIASLRLHSLGAPHDDGDHDMARVEELTNETRTLSQELKDRIRKLEAAPAEGDARIRNNRIGLLRKKFLESIQNYQRIEQEGRAKTRQRAERQVRIVNPGATVEEVNAAVEGGGQQIFMQALTNSTRYAESRSAFREVQQRQQDLQRMERTLAELAQLFIDMGTIVEQHDAIITDAETTAGAVAADTEKGLQATQEATIHARRARKKKWICFFIVLGCLAVVAIVLGVIFGTRK